jgi:hypothetical protein
VQLPDYIEPFIGWKGLLANPDNGQLCSPRGHHWPTGEAFVARCDLAGSHEPPHPKCSCGIYAVETLATLIRKGYSWSEQGFLDPRKPDSQLWVVAEVKLWGEVRPGAIGFRTHKAYPAMVYVPAHRWRIGQRVADLYDCRLGYYEPFSGETMLTNYNA